MSLSNFFKSALSSVLWGFASFSVADSSPPLSFLDAYAFAQTAAPDLAVARYKVESRDADRAIALAKILPQANLFGQFSDNRIRYDAELSNPFDAAGVGPAISVRGIRTRMRESSGSMAWP